MLFFHCTRADKRRHHVSVRLCVKGVGDNFSKQKKKCEKFVCMEFFLYYFIQLTSAIINQHLKELHKFPFYCLRLTLPKCYLATLKQSLTTVESRKILMKDPLIFFSGR